jgi:hypothetical protein
MTCDIAPLAGAGYVSSAATLLGSEIPPSWLPKPVLVSADPIRRPYVHSRASSITEHLTGVRWADATHWRYWHRDRARPQTYQNLRAVVYFRDSCRRTLR